MTLHPALFYLLSAVIFSHVFPQFIRKFEAKPGFFLVSRIYIRPGVQQYRRATSFKLQYKQLAIRLQLTLTFAPRSVRSTPGIA